MSFIFSLFGNTDKAKTSLPELEAIQSLKKQLVDVGFASDEVEFMIRSHSHKRSLLDMGTDDLRNIKELLSVQLDIARRCLNLANQKD
ncbi:hypothetical protein [Candidatus Formimonas warabiya]|uniref:Uncharacterized protein n=1 Tax=Formimonas warabiya TaxID=1761012 RepID=A0A3G1KPX7_FORW1|nr:hypothetical protein [Candidatus Formimonas warabiya]ATW24529.1 hypothetical protein DCMF_06810 [Candidatus Formimonas warabiya]